MKARSILPVLLLAALLLAGCGAGQSGGSAPEPSPDPTPAELRLPEPLSEEESQAMAMVLNANRVRLGDEVLFCYDCAGPGASSITSTAAAAPWSGCRSGAASGRS